MASLTSAAQAILIPVTAFFLLTGNALGQAPERYVVVDSATALAHVLDASTNTELAAVHTGASPNSVVISPNLHLAFVANINSYYLSVLDLTIGAEIKRIRNVRLAQLALSADGQILVGTDVEDDGITVIDAVALTVKNHISLNGLLGDDPSINGDLIPTNPVIIGNNVYLNTSHDVGTINISTGAVMDIASTPVSLGLGLMEDTTAATPDGKFVIANRFGALLVIDASTNTVAATLPMVTSTVFSIAATRNASDPTNILAYLLRDTGVDRRFSVLDLSSGSATFGGIIGEVVLPAGFRLDFFAHITSNANGTRAYVSSASNTPNVVAIDTSAATGPVVVSQASIGFALNDIAAGVVQGPPSASSLTPVIADVTPLVTNDAARTIQIFGSGFTPDSQIRIGNLDTVAGQFISPSSLQVTIPQNAAAQAASVIVTNPNQGQSIVFQNLSGILRNALVIANPSTFQPENQVGVTNFGDSSFSVLNTGMNTTFPPSVFAGQRPLGFAITPDGSRAYIENRSAPGTIAVYNFGTGLIERSIILDPACGPLGQGKAIVLAKRLGTGQLTAFTLCTRRVSRLATQDLYMIDAEPSSPTFNTVARIPTGNPRPGSISSGPLAITPDGHFAFINNFDTFIVLDLSNGAFTPIPNSALGIPTGFNPNIELSPDGKFLVSTAADFQRLLVFDITSPTAPLLVATVRGGAQFPSFPRIVGNRLFSFDGLNNTVDIFNFNPTQNNFAELATFVVPGVPSPIGAIFDVTPDGTLLYLPMREEDSVAVLDVNKIVAHDPTAVVTKLAVGIAPSMAGIRPALVLPNGLISVSTNNAGATFRITDGVANTFTGGGMSFTQTAPPGIYTITFGLVSGFSTPAPQTQALPSAGTISFSGNYQLLVASPTDLHATVGNGSVTLDWNSSQTQDVDGYNIYLEQFIGDHFTALGTLNPIGVPFVGTHFVVAGPFSEGVITNGILYRFHITAVKTGVESLPSNLVLARPGQFALSQLPPPPQVPVLFLHGICLLSNDTDGATYWKQTTDFLTNDLHWTDGGTLKYLSSEDPRDVSPVTEHFVPGASFYTATFGNCKANYFVENPFTNVRTYFGRAGILHQADEVHGFVRKLNASGMPQVNIVAHSMGGMAARSYIADNPGTNSVLNFITYGSPHWGVPFVLFVSSAFDQKSDGARDLTVQCAFDLLGNTRALDYGRTPFLDNLRQMKLSDGIRYVNIRGQIPTDAPPVTDFLGCLSLHWDFPIPTESADLVIPAHAPINQALIVRRRTLITTDRIHTSQPADFASILCALDLNCVIYRTHSPVDIEIIAPDGRMITRQLTEIPGASYMDVSEEAGTSATVLLPFPLDGEYSIKVIPKPGAAATDSYSLDVTRAGVTTVLAQDQSIQAIPNKPYAVTVLPSLAIDINPDRKRNTIELEDEGKITVVILSTPSFNARSRIDTTTLSFGHSGDEHSLASCRKSRQDADGGGSPDLVCHFFTQKTGFILNDKVGILKGTTKDGVPFVGTGAVRVIAEDQRQEQ